MNLTLRDIDAMPDGPMRRAALAQLREPRIESPRAAEPTRTRTKYRNVRTPGPWGRTYDSRAEAARAWELFALLDAGELVEVVTQPYVWLAGIVYRPDFLVIGRGGEAHYEDVKGRDVQRTRDVIRLWREHKTTPLVILRRGKGGTWERETITAATAA